jgi:hypothetical protein
MKPIDFRNATFAHLRATVLVGDRAAVAAAWAAHGPGTTRNVAILSGIDILTFRPRTTELYQAGFVQMLNTDGGNEGIYGWRTQEQHETWIQQQRANAISQQMQLI